jgi:hypothetical protein
MFAAARKNPHENSQNQLSPPVAAPPDAGAAKSVFSPKKDSFVLLFFRKKQPATYCSKYKSSASRKEAERAANKEGVI